MDAQLENCSVQFTFTCKLPTLLIERVWRTGPKLGKRQLMCSVFPDTNVPTYKTGEHIQERDMKG